MIFKRLTNSEDKIYEKAMELYSKSFPIYEQRLPERQKKIMTEPEYNFLLIFDGDIWVGELLCWETEDFIYVEHFCTLPEMRGRGCGAQALALLGERKKTVILEIDPPKDEVSVRRKAFYERAGYRANPFEHIHPPYSSEYKGHRLVVMTYPTAISEDEYKNFNSYLENVVMKK